MKRIAFIVLQVVLVLGAFAVGTLVSSPEPVAQTESEVWTCSMHPQVRAGEPGPCPLCGMDLIPVSTASNTSANRVVLSERAKALAKLRTTVVKRQGDASAEVRLLGRVEPDESTRKNVTTWIGGRIDRLHVNTTGEQVRAGQRIATLYSPEVYAAHQDLLTAKGQVARLANSTDATRSAASSALEAARDRLRLLGVPASTLSSMEEATQPTQSVAIRTPFAGTVIERVATEGAYVETGAPLYRIANLDQLWVQLDAYESDLPRISVGQTVSITVEGIADPVDGTVAFVDPTIDPQRRTARVRVAIDKAGDLRPGMFAQAVVSSPTTDSVSPLVIPASAPLFTGKRSIVYVEIEREDGTGYEPRTVRLGPRLGEVYPVVTGLSEGERVVSRGAFAVDADLQIQGGQSMMSTPDDDTVVELTPAQRQQLSPTVEHYLEVQRALAEDDHPTAAAAARAVEAAAAAVDLQSKPWATTETAIRLHARKLAESSDIEAARGAFEPLSASIEALLTTFGNPLSDKLHVAHCPMARGNKGARWVQQGETIDNAYFGAMMRSCGDIASEISPGRPE